MWNFDNFLPQIMDKNVPILFISLWLNTDRFVNILYLTIDLENKLNELQRFHSLQSVYICNV